MTIRSDTGPTNNSVLSNGDWTLKLNNNAYAGTGVSGNTGTVVKILFNGATSNGWNAYGALGLDVQGQSGGKGDLFFNTGGTTNGYERMRIKYGGNVGIGETSPDCRLHVNAGSADDALKLESTDNAVNLILTDAACYSSIQQNNDMLNINSDPGSTVSASTIRFNIDGVNVGTFLNNQFRLGSNSAGIQFNGDTAAVNSLDDYEEGTWTPSIGTTSGASVTGEYRKIGKAVHIQMYVSIPSHSNSSTMNISGLPFSSIASRYASFTIGNFRFFNFDGGYTQLMCNQAGTTMTFREQGDNTAWQNASWDQVSADFAMYLSGTYFTA
jgi:hypothetical protein